MQHINLHDCTQILCFVTHNRYKANVACDLITVWTLSNTEKVTSFRSASASDVFLKLLETTLDTEPGVATPWTAALEEKERRRSRVTGMDKKGSLLPQEKEEETNRMVSKQEARRLKKEMRKKEVKSFFNRNINCNLVRYKN